ncbi:MAG: hypothetical protein WED27_01075 [Pirellulales bacterium]
MTRTPGGATGRERIFVEMAAAAANRDPDRRNTLVCLLDGERALWEMADEWLPRAVGYVSGGLRRLCDEHRLKGEKRRRLMAAITSYENNREHLRYDEYLAAGYPIGSGVAEGACRYLVLRAVHLNEHWDEFIEYHIQAEQDRLYSKAAA